MPRAARGESLGKVKGKIGLSRDDVESTGSGRIFLLKKGQEKTVQFLVTPKEFFTYKCHIFQDEGGWKFIPCLARKCPLCKDDDPEVAKTNNRWVADVWNHTDSVQQFMEQGAELGEKLYDRYEKRPKSFLKRVWDIKRSGGSGRTSYDIDAAMDVDPVDPTKLKKRNLEVYVQEKLKDFYGMEDDDALDEDVVDDTEEEEEEVAEVESDDEEEEEGEDDEEEDEDEDELDDESVLDSLDDFPEEEEEEPAPKKKTAGKTAGKKRRPRPVRT